MLKRLLMVGAAVGVFSTGALANSSVPANGCPTFSPNALGAITSALKTAIGQVQGNLGLGLNMWATLVAADGTVCYVANSSGDAIQGQWLASRVISAQKAFTAATLSLGPTSNSGSGTKLSRGALALSTANLYSAVQPGGSLFGLQASNPVAADRAYGDTLTISGGVGTNTGPTTTANYGTANDPMIGQVIGGINVFGGGLALYTAGGVKIGGLGVSGDTFCTDHLIAWHLRHNLGLDHLGTIAGVSGDTAHPDNIVFDITNGVSASGWGHPACAGSSNTNAMNIAGALPPSATNCPATILFREKDALLSLSMRCSGAFSCVADQLAALRAMDS